MKTVSCKEVSPAALYDALNVAGGLFSMNAPYAAFYVFNCDQREVTSGMFAGANEDISNYTYALDFAALAGVPRHAARRGLRRVADIETERLNKTR